MGCCIGREELSPKNHLIIDVQQVIADDAWEEFVISSRAGCNFRWMFLKRSDYIVEVPMNYYHFEEAVPKFNPRKRIPGLHDSDVNDSKKASTSAPTTNPNNPEQIGLKTKFKNDTDKDQTYNFRFEKSRRAAVEVTYQRGFSIGGSANFKLGLPMVLPDGELSSEINMHYEVTSAKGQTFEETLTTEATSGIIVSKNSKCIANVIMEERRLLSEFTLQVTMSMPAKQALVFIKNKKGRVVFLKAINNLSMLFPDHTHIKENGVTREDAVQFVIHGVVDGMQLSNHYIHLKGRKIPAKPTAAKTASNNNATNKAKDFSEPEFSDF